VSVEVWSLPGPRRLLRELREAIDNGRSVLLLHPESVALDGLEQRLMRTTPHRRWHRVELEQLANHTGTLVQRLLDHLGHGDLAEGGDALTLVQQLRGAVLWLVPPHAEATHDAQLGRLLRDFAAAASRQEQHERAVVACVSPPERVSPAPPSDGGLLRRYWWGQVSPLDTLVVVDEVMDQPRVAGDREVVAELAGWDLALAEQLALRWSGDALVDLAAVSPQRRDVWHGGGLFEQAHLASATAPMVDPPEELLAAWAGGCVDWWGGRAVVHTSCHLAHGHERALEGRVWRGQVAAVLPLVEVARERLARWVEQRSHLVDAAWRYRDVSKLEVGPLERLFSASPGLRRSNEHYELARLLRRTRHQVAHVERVDRTSLARIETLLHGELFT
jgi:hypothetical protein